MNGLDVDTGAPRVHELARNVGVPLLIDSTINADQHEPFHNSNQGVDTIGSWLYKNLLRRREHFYSVMLEFVLVVSSRNRELVAETGLFGLLGEDTAIVPTTDTEILRQYKDLFSKYDVREQPYDPGLFVSQHILTSLINGEDQGPREPQILIRGLLEEICDKRGELDVSVDDLMSEDGSVKRDHPAFERLGISMPTCKKVVIFELRVLETLLEDSFKRIP